ncbi:dienelactone hydrolase family protein [Synoicihabitans lomoniglobus]|uniref:PHB depolymerase family esterase n=1 Tax=Synoicihabitans lomoniglobus TaxID=2909285 RepID=A0AAF0CQZ0_9BACT|nr:dienelactone hydrolase family protein [Opitutaceae bacterium LMO-M01]WED66445.1 PHB depolymerase family esterase [Opitutaceae bacterium LMO-M01]
MKRVPCRLFRPIGLSRPQLLLLCALVSGLRISAQNVDIYEDVSVPGLPGRLYVPPEAMSGGSPRPLIVALHGGGAIGTDNRSNVVDFWNLLAVAQKRGAFLYAPQATATWRSAESHARVLAQVQVIMANREVDADRVYLTGFSMGGGGVWNLLVAQAETFAAAVPICGVTPATGFTPAAMRGVPLWVFHARDDPVVSVGTSRAVVNSILVEHGQVVPSYPTARTGDFEIVETASNLRYTEWASGGHGIWNAVYAHAALAEWMFAQSQSGDVTVARGPRIVRHPVSVVATVGDDVTFTIEAQARSGPLAVTWWREDAIVPGEHDLELNLQQLNQTQAGVYRARLSDDTGEVWTWPAELKFGDTEPGAILNVSMRGTLAETAPKLTAGFVIGGSAPGRVLVRAVGPGLVEHGVADVVEDPELAVFWHRDGGAEQFAINDDWSAEPLVTASLVSAMAQVGAFPLTPGSRDAALVVDLPAGVFSVQARGRTADAGDVLIEIYELR